MENAPRCTARPASAARIVKQAPRIWPLAQTELTAGLVDEAAEPCLDVDPARIDKVNHTPPDPLAARRGRQARR